MQAEITENLNPEMKIAQIGSYPVSADCIRGGVEASVYGLAQELVQSHDVVCFDLPRMEAETSVAMDGAVRVYRYKNIGKHQKDMIDCLNRLLSDIQGECPDVCHIHGTGLLAQKLYRSLRNQGYRLMLTVHGLGYIEKKNQLTRKFSLGGLYKLCYQSRAEFALLKMAPKAIVDTDYVGEALRRYPCRIPDICTVPQGINSRYFEMRCSPESRVVLSVGSIGMRKGHLYTIDAFDKMRAKGCCAVLKIYGVKAEDLYYHQLMGRIAESPYAAEIELHPNAPLNELMQAYQDAHLFVLHSQEESQGIVFAEAMACGLPVVATKVGGIPYVVKDGQTGILCNYTDSDAMADAMVRLMSDDALWNKMSAAAREEACHYKWSSIAEKILNLY